MKVIGLVGRIGSGKDEVVRYLSINCEARKYSEGEIVREIARTEGLQETRKNLHAVSLRYAREKGEEFFAKKLSKKILQDDPLLATIGDIRRPADEEVMRRRFGDRFLLCHVEADFDIRFRRSHRRGEARDTKSEKNFRYQDREEEKLFHLGETISRADLTLDNKGTLEELHRQIDEKILPWILHNNR